MVEAVVGTCTERLSRGGSGVVAGLSLQAVCDVVAVMLSCYD